MAKTPKSIATLKNPLALRQRRWVRKLGYTPPSLKRGRKRTFDDIRLRRFKTFRPALERRLKPPVEADEGQAKALSSENRYPVFESGHLSHHEDTVGEVLESLDSAVMEIERSGQHTEAQAAAIRAELENFRALAKAAYESANRSDVLAQEATALYEESRQVLEQRAGRSYYNSAGGTDENPGGRPEKGPETPVAESEPTTPAPRPPGVRAELTGEAAAARANLALAKSKEAQEAAQNAATKAEAMRESLTRLNGLVKDAALTAHGLPDDHRDDAADAKVGEAQAHYREAYQAASKAYTLISARLDRAFWVRKHAEDAVSEARALQGSVGGAGAIPTEMSRARSEERGVTSAGRAPSTVASRAAKFFSDARPARGEGVPLTAKFGAVPEPPPYNPPPPDVPGRPRAYQRELLDDLKDTAGYKSVLVTAPTGAGKTFIFSRYIADLRRQGKTVAVMAHTKELIDQAGKAVESATGEKPGIVQGQEKDWRKPVTVISHGTVADNPRDVIPSNFKPDVLIVDEAHHAAAEGFQSIIKAVGSEKLVGFTATPYRADNQDLRKTFDVVICRVETADLIRDGYLVPPTIVDVALAGEDGQRQGINKAGNLPELYAEGIARARSQGRKKIIVFVASGPSGQATDIVKHTTDALNSLGVDAGEVMGSTDPKERDRIIEQFRRKDQGVLINFGTLNEGFDAPSTDAIVLGRNVNSDGTLAQIMGRGMRPDPKNRKKTDVLVFNYSSRSADDIRRVVYNQVGGGKSPIICNPNSGQSRAAVKHSQADKDRVVAALMADIKKRDAARAEQKTSKPRRAKSPGRPSKSTTKSAPYGGGRVLIVRS